MSPNFRLSIVGLDCNRISKIEWARTIPDLTAKVREPLKITVGDQRASFSRTLL